MKTYKPLPDNLTIKPSSIHGLGLFATEDIFMKDYTLTTITTSHLVVSTDQTGISLTPNRLFRLEAGGYINHSTTPNISIRKMKSTDLNSWKLYGITPTRDIKAGEELTLDYTRELCGLTGYEDADFLKEEFKSCLSDIEKYGF